MAIIFRSRIKMAASLVGGRKQGIAEVLGNRQYCVRVDGSNRVTLRNRRFLSKIRPVIDVPQHSTQGMSPSTS